MWRKWVSGLAVLGMLLHVALVVRHHAMMTTAELAIAEQAAVISTINSAADQTAASANLIICQAPLNKVTGSSGTGEKGSTPHCPLCLAGHVNLALLPSNAVELAVPNVRPPGQIAERDQRSDALRKLRPPARASPSLSA